MANGRKARNFIPAISMAGQTITNQIGKEEAFHEAYSELLGKTTPRQHTLDLDFLGIEAIDLSDQDQMFQEEEIWNVIKEMLVDCAPGPDGFTGMFFQKA